MIGVLAALAAIAGALCACVLLVRIGGALLAAALAVPLAILGVLVAVGSALGQTLGARH